MALKTILIRSISIKSLVASFDLFVDNRYLVYGAPTNIFSVIDCKCVHCFQVIPNTSLEQATYFKYDLLERVTSSLRHHNLNRFIASNPKISHIEDSFRYNTSSTTFNENWRQHLCLGFGQ